VASCEANFGRHMSWVAPLGLPVSQVTQSRMTEYKLQARPAEQVERIRHALQNTGITHSSQRYMPKQEFIPANVVKEAMAIAPNFIHSIDAAHAQLTALRMNERGHAFQSVHDSYWSHAATCNELNTELRQAFFDIHRHNLIDDLIHVHRHFTDHSAWPGKINLKSSNGLQKVMGNMEQKRKMYTTVPERGDLNIECVLDSKYFFC